MPQNTPNSSPSTRHFPRSHPRQHLMPKSPPFSPMLYPTIPFPSADRKKRGGLTLLNPHGSQPMTVPSDCSPSSFQDALRDTPQPQFQLPTHANPGRLLPIPTLHLSLHFPTLRVSPIRFTT